MFYPVEGGSVYEVKDNAFGFVFTCHLPPVGYGVNVLTGRLEQTDIICRSDVPKEQMWERYQLPKDWNAKRKIEKERQRFDRYYYDPYLEEIRQREWKRRLCGVWFWNYNPKKGKSECIYMTGTHYLYCTYWRFQGKYMDFRMTDLEVFYALRYCETDPDSLGLVFLTKRKLGKCFGKDTLIRMYDGSVKKVQDISDGETVMGNDSTPRIVSGCINGKEKMYLIKANKGESFTCNESHILTLKWNGAITVRDGSRQKGDIVNISVKDYLKLKPHEKAHLVQYREGWGKHYPKVEHKIPPYMLGLYLGDGSINKGDITNTDIEIINYIKDFANSNNLICKQYDSISYSISGKKRGDNFYRSELIRLGVMSRKFIPREYLIDSYENRMELLAGIIDTDGYLCYNKNSVPTHYEITQKNEDFANQFAELARSCGFHASISVKKATIKRDDGTIFRGNYWRININGDLYKIPVKVSRRKCHLIDRRKNSLNFGFKVQEIGEGDYYGFAVDKNNLFLLADGTVVHNTAVSGVWAYDRTSRPPKNQHCGIQSKDDDGAEEVFKKAIVQPWQKLPDFFRPIYDTMKGDDPNVLRFFHTSRRGSTAEEERDDEEALESWIDFGPATEGYYDGPELDTYISDEAGKVEKKISIRTRQDVVRYCSEIDGVMKGKQLYTTTVEADETTADEHEFQELVYDSNPLKRNENNRTITGLYTLFVPAHKGFFFDSYGFPDEDRAKTFLNNTRSSLLAEGKLRQLASAKRKNPMTLEEAFSVDGENALYNPILLQEQLDRLSWGDAFTEMGDLEWENGDEFWTEVELSSGEKQLVPNKIKWIPRPTGRFEKVKGWMPKEPNAVYERNGQLFPNASYTCRIGCDPFRYDKTKDKRRSNCAAFAYQIPDENRPDKEFDNIFGLRYSFRAESTKAANMDILKMAWWCGCQVLFERNVNHWKEHFAQWNCSGFLMWMPNELEPGVFTGGSGAGALVQTICNYTEAYINEHVQKVYFKTLIRKDVGWLGFKVEDTQKFDEPMAAGITLLAVKGKKYRLPTAQVQSIENILPYHKAV